MGEVTLGEMQSGESWARELRWVEKKRIAWRAASACLLLIIAFIISVAIALQEGYLLYQKLIVLVVFFPMVPAFAALVKREWTIYVRGWVEYAEVEVELHFRNESGCVSLLKLTDKRVYYVGRKSCCNRESHNLSGEEVQILHPLDQVIFAGGQYVGDLQDVSHETK